MEFIIGATASCGAVLFSNPFDVLKTRMQLQGELKLKGHYTVVYKNVFHAFYSVVKVDGLLALQKGLRPAMAYQIVLNGTRFGLYQTILDSGLISEGDGTVSSFGCILAGAGVGIVGGFLGSPLYMIKTQLQAQAHSQIAVGHQHKHKGAVSALKIIYKNDGIMGLWRGASTAIPRVGVGSASQLFIYSKSKDWLSYYDIFGHDSWQSTLVGAFSSGIFIATFMSPFDVISTRVYNQDISSKGKGLMYRGVLDCFMKTVKIEGIRGLYKGWAELYLRIGPHSFFNLLFWDNLKYFYRKFIFHQGHRVAVKSEHNILVHFSQKISIIWQQHCDIYLLCGSNLTNFIHLTDSLNTLCNIYYYHR